MVEGSQVKHPILKAIAKDILAIPISTIAFKSAFSTSGRLVSSHRNRLHPNIKSIDTRSKLVVSCRKIKVTKCQISKFASL